MDTLKITMTFIPPQKTRDDPLGQRAYFVWEAEAGNRAASGQHQLNSSLYRDGFTDLQLAALAQLGVTEAQEALR